MGWQDSQRLVWRLELEGRGWSDRRRVNLRETDRDDLPRLAGRRGFRFRIEARDERRGQHQWRDPIPRMDCSAAASACGWRDAQSRPMPRWCGAWNTT